MIFLYAIEKDACHMPIEQWWASVEVNAFTPDDGFGYFAFSDTRTDIPVLFDKAEYNDAIQAVAEERRPTHAVWFNK